MVFDEEMLLHKSFKKSHPERPERLMSIYLNLINKGYLMFRIRLYRIYDDLVKIEAEPADEEHILLVHPLSHIQKVKDTIYEPKDISKMVLLGPKKNSRRFQVDTYENKYTS